MSDDFAGTYTGAPNPRTMFVEGPFGAGKTTFAIETLFAWLDAGISPSRILIMIPQRTMALRYQLALRDAARGPMGDVDIRTIGGIAKDTCNLYWPIIAEQCGFADASRPPRFLTIETSQYAMAEFVKNAVERGEFDAVSISPQQIARQIVDNLTKAAIMKIDFRHVPNLLAEGWGGERPRKRLLAYEAAGKVAEEYRAYCMANNLLDFPLQLEMFNNLMVQPQFREQFFNSRSHLIVEHLQEETSVSHDLIYDWLPRLEGVLLTYEWDSGYRIFLGASPEGAEFLRQHCEGILTLNRSFITSPAVDNLEDEVAVAFGKSWAKSAPPDEEIAFSYAFHSFFPQMLDWVADKIQELVVRDGIPPREIAVLAPYLSDALRFSLGQKLEARGIQSTSHRPSRALKDEPAARALLTLVALAHPIWGYQPPLEDVAQAFHLVIDDLDPIRARLLARITYRPNATPVLSSFEKMVPEMQSRITFRSGERYEMLRIWLLNYSSSTGDPLDHVFSRLFGEVLSQPGFGFHNDPSAGRITAELVESARSFRRSLFDEDNIDYNEIGRRYFTIVTAGLLAGLYVASWRDELADAVFMAPAYTFLMRNRAADVQFWLDVGSIGWWERLDQPLTHPYVLSKNWPPGTVWSDSDEYTRQQDMLFRVMTGLIRRTRKHIYLGISDLGESGFEQRGPLLRVFQSILRKHPKPSEAEDTD